MSPTTSAADRLSPSHHTAPEKQHEKQHATAAYPKPTAALKQAVPVVVTPDNWPGGVPVHNFGAWLTKGAPLVAPAGNLSFGYRFAKRLLDIAGALVALTLFAPAMLVTFVALCVTTRGNPLFRQERVGLGGKLFPMYKFRTMRIDALAVQHQVRNQHSDGPIFKNRRDPRITRLGRILRSTSIDETPQLFSVLVGHMSLVGPRPPIASEVMRYEPWQVGRLSVKPGLTCLWQVSGRSEIGFVDWVKMDLWYVENQSLWTDMVLLVRTPLALLSRRGAY
jgi:lipopolysaccharide/colanic/teichoic acid biosynthesis glycosyltransferase